MPRSRTLRLYLDAHVRARLEAGRHNFFAHVVGAFEDIGWRVRIRPDTRAERARSYARPGYALFHMERPTTRRSLTTRLAYTAPFWRIEAQAERWKFEVSTKRFDADQIDPDQAADFRRRTIKRLYPWVKTETNKADYIYVPLQANLLRQRGFQAASPIDMLRDAVRRFPDRPIVVSLHPKVRYAEVERAEVADVLTGHSDAHLSKLSAEALLPGARLVVTQNSSVAFLGYFLDVPAVLYGGIDFHHIAGNVAAVGVDQAFEEALQPEIPYAQYLYWFLKENGLNAGAPDIRAAILERVRAHGRRVN